jgi:hypothetical protein
MLRKTLGPKKHEVSGKNRVLCKKELHYLYRIISALKSGALWRIVHIGLVGRQ